MAAQRAFVVPSTLGNKSVTVQVLAPSRNSNYLDSRGHAYRLFPQGAYRWWGIFYTERK